MNELQETISSGSRVVEDETLFVGQAVMDLEHEEWSNYLDTVARENLTVLELDEFTTEMRFTCGSDGTEAVLPIHQCPACGNELDDNEQCRTCGFGAIRGDFYLPSQRSVNWAEAYNEY